MLVKTGQALGHWGSFLLDPRWLLETNQSVDFSTPQTQQHWGDSRSYAGAFVSTCQLFDQICTSPRTGARSPAPNCSTDGADGVKLTAEHNDTHAVCLSSTETGTDSVLVWNFPSGESGVLDVTLQLTSDFNGATIALTDYFAPPYDEGAEQPGYCASRTNCSCGQRCAPLFVVPITPRDGAPGVGVLPGCGNAIAPRTWTTLRIAWDIGTGWAELEMPSSGGEATRLALTKHDNEGAASYVRVRGRGLCVRGLSKQSSR